MMNAYTKTVTGTASVIVPAAYKVADDFAAGAVSEGDYVASYGRVYWALNAGTAVTAPTHLDGIDTLDSIDWLLIDRKRHLIISVHNGDEVTLGRDDTPTIDEGIFIYAPYDLGNYVGEVQAISGGSVVVGISLQ